MLAGLIPCVDFTISAPRLSGIRFQASSRLAEETLKLILKITLLLIGVFSTGIALAGAHGGANQKLNTPDNSQVTAQRRVDGNGVVRAMYNVNSHVTGTTPEQIARTFLQENSDAFQLFGSTSSLITDD
ncbi:MAG: hypothetical protein HW412_1769, partial [Bacteroidetes bacterium]|nr:hypothetical protein [Bacteroidota bacterium]